MKTERQNFLNQPFMIPADVLIIPVHELAESVRSQIECDASDYAVTRPGYRTTAKIIDAGTVDLLEEFREPVRIADAIVRYANRKQRDPTSVLQAAFPLLTRFSTSQLLVPADSPLAEDVSASFANGQCVAGHTIVALVQALQDTELYQAQTATASAVALKVARPDVGEDIRRMLAREQIILTRLRGVCAPRLIDHGQLENRLYLAIEWIAGKPISMRADELRYAAAADWRSHLHALACALIEAYTQLHERQVLHGDIHSGNIFVDAHDRVILIDFGLASCSAKGVLAGPVERSAMAWFMEPEAATCLLNSQPLPDSTARGEQYSVAALIYHLISGEHHVQAPMEQKAFLQQVISAEPLPFSRRGFESWPAVEVVIARALAKNPDDRYLSMRAFLNAFRAAHYAHTQTQWSAATQLPNYAPWFQQLALQLQTNADTLDLWFPKAPQASVHAGACGLAWSLYRAAQRYDSADLLTSADILCRRAFDVGQNFNAFHAPAVGITPQVLATESLYHSVTGLHVVHALVCHARGDFAGTGENITVFLQRALQSSGAVELFLGRSGLLIGAALMLEAIRGAGKVDPVPLQRFLSSMQQTLWREVADLPAVDCCVALPHLGMAHGWAGILYAQMRVRLLLGDDSANSIEQRLDEVAHLAVAHGQGVSWPGSIEPISKSATPDHAPGWCAGTAGYVHLWLMAHECFGDSKYLQLAEQAAWYSYEHNDTTDQLCCGLSGRAWALLKLYQYTGNREWQSRATQLALRALGSDQSGNSSMSTFALFRGALGTRLLVAELSRPETAAMPMFAAEGWNSGNAYSQ